jgi:hypothetical protein
MLARDELMVMFFEVGELFSHNGSDHLNSISSDRNPAFEQEQKGREAEASRPSGDATEERQPLQQSTDLMAAGEEHSRHCRTVMGVQSSSQL